MTLWLSGQFSKFGLAFLWELRDNRVMKTLQFLSLKPRSRIRILLHRTLAIEIGVYRQDWLRATVLVPTKKWLLVKFIFKMAVCFVRRSVWNASIKILLGLLFGFINEDLYFTRWDVDNVFVCFNWTPLDSVPLLTESLGWVVLSWDKRKILVQISKLKGIYREKKS